MFVGNHYFSIIKLKNNKTWTVCDDSRIYEQKSNKIFGKSNYLFFYKNKLS